jgi:hypothetical protein
MGINESTIRRIIREEARRILRESEEEFDEEGDPEGDEGEDESSPESVIARFKEDGPRMWMRVSNDFHEMADGGDMDGFRESQYPGWSDEDFRRVAKTLDKHFGF